LAQEQQRHLTAVLRYGTLRFMRLGCFTMPLPQLREI